MPWLGGLLLGGAPIGLMDGGAGLIDAAGSDQAKGWLAVPIIAAAALTGGAVLRAAGRIFLGWGETAGEEKAAPTEVEAEENRPLWLMLAPCILLLAAALFSGERAAEFAWHAVPRFIHPDGSGMALGAVPEPPHPFVPWLSVCLAIGIAAFDLGRRHLPRMMSRPSDIISEPLFRMLHTMHDGVVGDYVAWIVGGLALFAVVLGFAT